MSRTNLISATLSPEKKTEILHCLSEAQSSLGFLVNLSTADKKRLTKMGARSVGYVDECIATFDSNKQLLPSTIDLEELKRDRALYDNLSTIAMVVKTLEEGLQDTLAALGHDLMINCNDGYAILKRSSYRDIGIKAAAERIGRRFQGQGVKGTTPAEAA
ncbi:MAG: hypothetical protein ACKVU2_09350 [Saprospiraceae bacterium]